MKTILAVVLFLMVAFSMVAGVAMAGGAVPPECLDGSCGSDLDCEEICGGEVEL